MRGIKFLRKSLPLLLCIGLLCAPMTACHNGKKDQKVGDSLASLSLVDRDQTAITVRELKGDRKILIFIDSPDAVQDSHLTAVERLLALYGEEWTICLLWKDAPPFTQLSAPLAANSYQADFEENDSANAMRIAVTDKSGSITSLPAAGFADLAKELVAAAEDKDKLLTRVVQVMREELTSKGILPQASDKSLLLISYMPTCRKCMPTVREIYKNVDLLYERYHIVTVLTDEDAEHPLFSENALLDTFAVYLRALQREDNIALIRIDGEDITWLTAAELLSA